MNLKRMSYCVAVLTTVSLTSRVQAANNLHFCGNLLGRSYMLVIQDESLAEVHFPAASRKDLMVAGQSARMPMVFQFKSCKGPAQYEVRVTLADAEDNEQPGFLALDVSSVAQGVRIGMEKTDGAPVLINNTSGVTFVPGDDNDSLNLSAWLQAKGGQEVTMGEFTIFLTVMFECT